MSILLITIREEIGKYSCYYNVNIIQKIKTLGVESTMTITFSSLFIAKSMEAAYEEMSAKECEKMLNLKKPDEARQFFAKKGWVVDNRKMIRFQDLASEEKKLQVQDMDVPAKELAQMAIRYAREMEQIV